MLSKAFEPIKIRGLTLRNRIAMLPMRTFGYTGIGKDAYGDDHVRHYASCAAGGAGMIVFEGVNVTGIGERAGSWTAGSIEALKRVSKSVKNNGSIIIMQLFFGGDKTVDVNALTETELEKKQAELLEAALLASELGFDGIEFHFAHGFLLSKLLDADTNKRTDKYGGNMENRIRIATEIIPEMRRHTNSDFVISARMGALVPSEDEGIEAALRFEDSGVDMLSVSYGTGGVDAVNQKMDVPASSTLHPVTVSAAGFKRAVKNMLIIGAYGLNNAEKICELFEKEYADIAGVGRGFLADPDFALHLRDGKLNNCLGCMPRCLWYTDYRTCPARQHA